MANYAHRTHLIRLVTGVIVLNSLLQLGKGAVEEKSCKAVRRDIITNQVSSLSRCAKSMKITEEKDFTCFLKCSLKMSGLFNEEGQVIQSTWDFYLHTTFPPSMISTANSSYFPCFPVSVIGFDNTDPTCKDYGPILACLQSKFSSFCRMLENDLTTQNSSGTSN